MSREPAPTSGWRDRAGCGYAAITGICRCLKLLGQSGGGRRGHAALYYWPPPVVGALMTTQRVLASGLR